MIKYNTFGLLNRFTDEKIDEGTMNRAVTPQPGPLGYALHDLYPIPVFMTCPNINQSIATSSLQSVSELDFSDQGLKLLGAIEELRLKPYDDQTSKKVDNWTKGATIGYGHLIKQGEWDTYKNGISAEDAIILFRNDLSPFINIVRSNITIKLAQNQFDALVILAYNIGSTAFAGSSVVKLVNDPTIKTNYASLEDAWKAWNKSQGKVMQGLINRRECEWNVYSKAIYKKW